MGKWALKIATVRPVQTHLGRSVTTEESFLARTVSWSCMQRERPFTGR
jgi:hypothetical protein